jgi:DNA-binding NtrC family response regulator
MPPRFRQTFYLRQVSICSCRRCASVQDVEALARHFVATLTPMLGTPPLELTPRVLARLAAYDWPGNVRELRNLIERSLILGWFDLGPDESANEIAAAPDETLEAVEKRHILATLADSAGNKSEAARRLGISRKTLDRKCTAWGCD